MSTLPTPKPVRTLRGAEYFKKTGMPLAVYEAQHGDDPIMPHAHDFIEVVLFARGTSVHEYAGQRYTLAPGDLFVIHPHEPHAYIRSENAMVYNCLFMPELLKPDLADLQKIEGFFDLFMVEPFFRPEAGLRSVLRLDPTTRVRVVELLKEVRREIAAKAPGYEVVARTMLIQLLVAVARVRRTATTRSDLKHGKKNGHAEINDEFSGKRALVRQCISYIEDHYPEEIRLENLADMAYLSPEYFSKVFKRLTEQSPIEFINRVRMEKAKQLLTHSRQPVTDIAFKTGFHDLNYFSRQFKKMTGQTPGDYRKQGGVKAFPLSP